MEAGAPVLLLLVSVSLGSAGAQGFYGDSISFLPPQKNSDGTFRRLRLLLGVKCEWANKLDE
ncbi:hypothetical protein INR49_019034 [Caranx melampygus]|nr:hypothetical protein INR49_019034 [Caranx melampygus]